MRSAGVVLLGCTIACTTAHRSVVRVSGSDTLVNLVQAWAEHYAVGHSGVSVQVGGGGSGVGIAGLIDGTVDIAAASRELRTEEVRRATARTGRAPREVTVALDAIAVYVHRDNPLSSLTIGELADIYGEDPRITRWSQLGVRHQRCASDTIIRVGRQNNSGTYASFRNLVLGRTREYAMGSIDQSGSKDVVALLSTTPCAIGYSGSAFATPGVRALALVCRAGQAPIAPDARSLADGSYPLARRLYFYTAADAPDHVAAFVTWVAGPDGQRIVRELGYQPVAAWP